MMYLLTHALLDALAATLLHLVLKDLDMPLAFALLRTRLLSHPTPWTAGSLITKLLRNSSFPPLLCPS